LLAVQYRQRILRRIFRRSLLYLPRILFLCNVSLIFFNRLFDIYILNIICESGQPCLTPSGGSANNFGPGNYHMIGSPFNNNNCP
jgi:hypothetical protein